MELTQTQISQLYVAVFGRASEKEGNEYWQKFAKEKNKNITDIATLMLNTDDAKVYFGDSLNTNLSFIQYIYLNTLNKTYAQDPEGIDFWTELLNNGLSRGEVISRLITAAQDEANAGNAQNQFNNRVDVSNYTANIIDKAPSDYATSLSFSKGIPVTHESNTVQNSKKLILDIVTSKETVVSEIKIYDGNYTYNGTVDIDVIFTNPVIVEGSDSTLTIAFSTGEQRVAYMSSFTSNSIKFKYKVEDGYTSKPSNITAIKDGITLNNTLVKDSSGLYASLYYDAVTNKDAMVVDIKSPTYEIYNAVYFSNTNNLQIYGENFNTILEYNETSSLNIKDRIVNNTLTWDFNGDDSSGSNTSLHTFQSADITLVKVISDNQLSIILNSDISIEKDLNYSFLNGNDTLDITQGFLKDTAGNISTINAYNDVIIGIDGYIIGNSFSNTLWGSTNDDIIEGKEGNDILKGLDGNDIIYAGDGDDIIEGGFGIDTLYGGLGDDIFIFNVNDSIPTFNSIYGIDKISDFDNVVQNDKIKLNIKVTDFNASVIGEINKDSFIENLNTLLSVNNKGFNTSINDEVSGSLVYGASGDLQTKVYLAVDLNANNQFDYNDFVVEITGSNYSNIDSSVFTI